MNDGYRSLSVTRDLRCIVVILNLLGPNPIRYFGSEPVHPCILKRGNEPQERPRVAVIIIPGESTSHVGFSDPQLRNSGEGGEEQPYLTESLLASLRITVTKLLSERQFEILDSDLVDRALKGRSKSNLINPSITEAAQTGSLIGADSLLLITGEVRPSRTDGGELEYLGWCSTHLVNGIDGDLLDFVFARARSKDQAGVLDQLILIHNGNLERCFPRLKVVHRSETGEEPGSGFSRKESPDPQSNSREHVQTPEITFRVKPVYTEEADVARIEATVEVEASFRSDGRIEDPRVIRWAGFGLDEAALAAVRQLRFKPALMAGTPIDTRQRMVYRFHRREP